MSCKLCADKAETAFYGCVCRQHFIELFEKKVLNTIKEFELLGKGEKIGVAASGGKDSTTILRILKKHGYNPTAIAIDEGIPGYRDVSLQELQEFCLKENIPLKQSSFKEALGQGLQEILAKNKDVRSCRTCGIFRRSLIAKSAEEFDKLVTGHNMDDEAQSILMNIASGSIHLLSRLGPASGEERPEFTRRVKPLYFCLEKEVATYAYFSGLKGTFAECPHAAGSIRNKFREILNRAESENPRTKRRVVEWLVRARHKLLDDRPLMQCERCGKPSSKEVCSACKQKSAISIQNVH